MRIGQQKGTDIFNGAATEETIQGWTERPKKRHTIESFNAFLITARTAMEIDCTLGHVACPLDAGPIPLVGEHRAKAEPVLRVYYCRFCAKLFAFTPGEGPLQELIASFTYAQETGGWRLAETYGLEARARWAERVVSSLRPNSDGTLWSRIN